MIVQGLVFYLFAAIMVASGAMVITARNPVHSVLFLILAFLNAAGLFILVGAEFVALILVIVYVGAVAVLFLFVVMMLDINFRELRRGFVRYLPVGATVGLILLVELALVVGAWALGPAAGIHLAAPAPPADQVPNTNALGLLLYTRYAYLFQAAGLILLIAMIGAIVLTLRRREDVHRQVVARQLDRRRDEALAIHKVPTRGGV